MDCFSNKFSLKAMLRFALLLLILDFKIILSRHD